MTKEELEDIHMTSSRRGINVDDIDIQADIAYQLTRIADCVEAERNHRDSGKQANKQLRGGS